MNYSYWVSHLGYLFDGILLIFTLSATLLGALTISNSMRLRNVQMSWKGGHLKGYPLISTLFLAFSFILLIITVWKQPEGVLRVAAYNWIGINWFMVSHMAAKVYITDYGIVKNINDPSQTIAWYQIIDLVEREENQKTIYTFLYFIKDQQIKSDSKKKCVRFELVIPNESKKAFRKILSYKLGRRFNCRFTRQSGMEKPL